MVTAGTQIARMLNRRITCDKFQRRYITGTCWRPAGSRSERLAAYNLRRLRSSGISNGSRRAAAVAAAAVVVVPGGRRRPARPTCRPLFQPRPPPCLGVRCGRRSVHQLEVSLRRILTKSSLLSDHF